MCRVLRRGIRHVPPQGDEENASLTCARLAPEKGYPGEGKLCRAVLAVMVPICRTSARQATRRQGWVRPVVFASSLNTFNSPHVSSCMHACDDESGKAKAPRRETSRQRHDRKCWPGREASASLAGSNRHYNEVLHPGLGQTQCPLRPEIS
jgi:hypothetical protein